MGMRGECEAYLAAFSRLALRPDPPPMGFHDASGYVKTQTQASAIILADLRESLEYALERMVGYAGTGIPDGQADAARLLLAADRDVAASRREFQRIRDQIGEHLENPLMIERREKRRGIDPGLERYPFS